MILLKLPFKLLVLPLILMLTLIELIGLFLARFSSILFNLLAGIMFLITIFSYLFGIVTDAEAMRMLTISFITFAIPHVAEGIVLGVTAINCLLQEFIKS